MIKYLLFLLILFSLSNIHYAENCRIKQILLDDKSVTTLYAGFNKTPLTVMFPANITGLALMNAQIKKQDKKVTYYNSDFIIEFKPGSYFFNIFALKEGGRGSVNVLYDMKTYVIDIVEISEKFYSSVTFVPMSVAAESASGDMMYTDQPTLIGLIEQAKSYMILRNKPQAVMNMVYFRPEKKLITEYENFSVIVREVYCYKDRDVLVFNTVFRNKSDSPIIFDPYLIRVVAGTKSVPLRTIKTSGVIPPFSDMVQWFAASDSRKFTGGKPLSAENDWTVMVVTDDMKKRITDGTSSIRKYLTKKSDFITTEILKSDRQSDLESLQKETVVLRKELNKLKKIKELRQ